MAAAMQSKKHCLVLLFLVAFGAGCQHTVSEVTVSKAKRVMPRYPFAPAFLLPPRLPEYERARKALSENPSSGPAKLTLGSHYLYQGKYDKAEPLLRSFNPPKSLESTKSEFLGYSLEGQGKLSEAAAAYAEAARVEENAEKRSILQLRVACCLLQLDELDKAKPFFEASIDSKKDNFEAIVGLGTLMLGRGNWREADRLYNVARPLAQSSEQESILKEFVLTRAAEEKKRKKETATP